MVQKSTLTLFAVQVDLPGKGAVLSTDVKGPDAESVRARMERIGKVIAITPKGDVPAPTRASGIRTSSSRDSLRSVR